MTNTFEIRFDTDNSKWYDYTCGQWKPAPKTKFKTIESAYKWLKTKKVDSAFKPFFLVEIRDEKSNLIELKTISA